MKGKIESLIAAVCHDVGHLNVDVNLERPDYQFGDYSTSLALRVSKLTGQPPREVAELVVRNLKSDLIDRVEIAGPGFINIFLSDKAIHESLGEVTKWPKKHDKEEVLVEFSNANPFKEMHLGHLYGTVVGDSISRLFEASGASVKRLSYHGDVGLHVAKWVWALGNEINWDPSKFDEAIKKSKESPLGYYYAKGAKQYEENEQAKKEIDEINVHVYKKDREDINQIYELGKKLSFDLMDQIFKKLDVTFDKRYLESESSSIGLQMVKDNTPKVFKQSEGAIVYDGEKVGLHTRVFITSKGLPTYEAKDLGLTELKDKDYPNAAKSVYITANEQTEYFKVMLAALKEINPALSEKTMHLTHGFLSLTSGKMSSRSGDVFSAQELLETLKTAVDKQFPESDAKQEIYLASLKYTFLKQRLGPDVVFDVESSVSLEGNSGPYIQYTYARARSILAKVKNAEGKSSKEDLEAPERKLAVKISEYPEIVDKAINECLPSHICTYLYELSQVFNNFYETNRVVGNERESIRAELINTYANVLKSGLGLFNIPTPEKM